MTGLESEKQVLGTQVRDVFEFLLDKGYEYTGTNDVKTDALGPYIEALFRHPASHRRVRVTYLPPAASQPDALLVFIENGETDSFAVHEFLRLRNAPSEELTSLELTSYEGRLNERIRAVLDAAKRAMEKYLAPVVSGGSWEHIPIDWAGYK